MRQATDGGDPAQPRKGLGFSPWTYSLIAVLLGVLAWPALVHLLSAYSRFSYRDEERQAHCMSNEAQLALAMLAYSADHDERLPIPANWAPAIFPYGGLRHSGAIVTSIYGCPSQRRQPEVAGIPWESGQGLSYAMSLALPFGKVDDCPVPAMTPLLFESDRVPAAVPNQAALRHQGGAIFAYLDGHVKWLQPERIDQLMGGK
jgi:prepilin-type processing-associated H-X9-DG protein